MLDKIVIANRGEIALRIQRACRELGIKTVAVHSTADSKLKHVLLADESVCIGPPESTKSYLNIPSIISAAEVTDAMAIHPGYGFLAENADFSNICKENGFSFIGPSGDIINAMGNKAQAKKTMKAAGVPIIPGNEGVLQDVKEARDIANEMGFPVMLKASAGGGGRGMRLVHKDSELDRAYSTARTEALTAFNNGELYLEKFVEKPRHIEIQILADSNGNIVSLGERECSIQRRHQKLLEESPSSAVDEDLRKRMGKAAIAGAKAVNYVGVGTVEFLLDKNKDFYFMEMNTRIQVEHPITEMVTGADLIKLQILTHAGQKFPDYLYKMKLRGHSIECRINAEDPDMNFAPSPMKITSFHMPGGKGVRIDSHAYAGYEIPSNYDSLIGKLIVHSPNRESAINRMERALEETIIEGPKTTIPFHQAIMKDKKFRSGDFDTGFLESFNYTKKGE